MIQPDDEDLLQARLDRPLTPAEKERLEHLLERSPEARRRARDLDTLARTLDELESSTPPFDIVPQVMERVAAMPDAGIRTHLATSETLAGGHRPRRLAGQRIGGMIMARKAMWGLAAAATIVLGVLMYRGFPSVGHGT